MAELFLAVVSCTAEREDCEQLSCAVALGSSYRRSIVPTSLEESSEAWQVPHAFSVCNITVLFGENSVANVSVPMMHLGQSKNKTLDEWFRLEPVTGPDVHAQLRLLLHLRRDAAGDKEMPPQCFQQLCQELLPKPSEDLQSGRNHLPTPLDGPAPTGFPAEIPAGADPSEEAADSQSLASELEALQRLCLSLTRAAQPETPQPPRGPEPVDEPPSPLKDSEPSIYDEARAQLLAQKEALERERSELNSHWSALQADQSTKQEVLAEMRAERLSIFSSVEELQAEVEDATAELKEAQAVSSSRLAVRRQLQAELNACAENFSKEAASQRRSTEALRVQRASLRCEAVELGRELQGCVGRGDELVSENLRLRTEAASLEEAEERTRSELQRFLASDSTQLQAAALRCRQLWIGMQHGAARHDSLAEGLDYEARLQTLREAADRISCSNGVSTRLHQKPRSSN